MSDRIEFYRDLRSLWRWRRLAENNEIVGAATEGYVGWVDVVNNAARINGSDLPMDIADEDET